MTVRTSLTDLDLGLTVIDEHILGHGGIVVAHVVDEVLEMRVLKLDRIKGNALRRGDGAGLPDDTAEQFHAVGILGNLEDLQTEQGADRVDGAVDDDLLPDVGTVVLVELGKASALGEDLGEVLAGLVGDRTVFQRAEVHQRALDLGGDAAARLAQLGAQSAGAAEDAVGREVPEKDVVVAETVNQGDQNGVRSDAGHRALHGVLQLGRLGDEDDDVHNADVVGGVGGLKAVQVVVGIGVDDELKAVLRDLVHVGLIAVHQRDVRTALAQVSGEAAACCAAADHGNFHRLFSSKFQNLLFNCFNIRMIRPPRRCRKAAAGTVVCELSGRTRLRRTTW